MSYLYHFTTWFLILAICSCTTSQSTTIAPLLPAEPISFTILQLNDVYEIAPLAGGKVGGLARVAGVLRQLESEDPNTIAVMAGDFFSPSFMGTLRMDNGEKIAGLQMVETLNAMGLDYATFGNHEFDLKTLALVESRMDASAFTYCSANARAVEDGTTRRFQQNGEVVADYALHTFTTDGGQELTLALVGIVLPFNKQPYVHYLDVEESFSKACAQAAQEADVVLGLTHLTVAGDENLAMAAPGLPLFMGGHDHTQMSRYVGETAITKADANAKTIYVHRITYYPMRKLTKIHSSVMPINDQSPVDAATQAVVDKWTGRVDELITGMGYDSKAVLMEVTMPLQGTEHAIRSSQTNFGKLANEAFRWAWPQADVYIFNSGSLRLDDNLVGNITAYDVLRSFPYGGPLVRISLNGTQLQKLLHTGDVTNKNEGGYMQRLQAEWTNDEWIINGQTLDLNASYTVVLPKFVAEGREANLGFLGEISHKEEDMLHDNKVKNDLRDIIMAYMQQL